MRQCMSCASAVRWWYWFLEIRQLGILILQIYSNFQFSEEKYVEPNRTAPTTKTSAKQWVMNLYTWTTCPCEAGDQQSFKRFKRIARVCRARFFVWNWNCVCPRKLRMSWSTIYEISWTKIKYALPSNKFNHLNKEKQ